MYSLFKYNGDQTIKTKYLWLKGVRNILIKCGLSGIWENQSQTNFSSKWLYSTVKQKLKDLFLQQWYSSIEQSNACSNYKLFKSTFGLEEYLIKNPPTFLNLLIKFRTRNHKLPIEKGKYQNVLFNERLCTLCNTDIGDEYHYLLVCKNLTSIRKQYLKAHYQKNPNVLKFQCLMTTRNEIEIRKLNKFIQYIMTNVI